MIINLTKDNYEHEIEQSTLPVIIDISATWCGPCQQMKPIMEQLAKELEGKYKFAEVNVDEARELAIKFGVTSVPTFVFIKNKQLKGKERGYMPAADLKAKIEEYLG